MAGFLSCCIKTGSGWEGASKVIPPEHVWVNAWTTDNQQRQPVGISYCELIFVNEEDVHDYADEREPSPDLQEFSNMVLSDAEAAVQPAGSAGPSTLPSVSSLVPTAGAGQAPSPPYPAPGPASPIPALTGRQWLQEGALKVEEDEALEATREPGEAVLVTPLMSGDAVVDLLSGSRMSTDYCS